MTLSHLFLAPLQQAADLICLQAAGEAGPLQGRGGPGPQQRPGRSAARGFRGVRQPTEEVWLVLVGI